MPGLDLDTKLKIYEQALGLNSVSFLVTDIKGGIIYVNNTFIERTGFLPDEVIGKNLGIFHTGFHSEAFYQKTWNKILEGTTWKGEVFSKKKNGESCREMVTISPIFDHRGILTYILYTKEDISDKNKSEWQHVINESRFRSFFAKSNAKILIFSVESFKIIEANEAALNFYGYTIEELSALNLKKEFIGFIESIQAELNDKSLIQKSVYTQKHRIKSGDLYDVEVFPAIMEFGDNVLIYSIIQDITQRKKAIEALKESESKKLALLKIMPDLIFVLDRNGIFIDVYTDQPDRIGIPPQRMLGKRCGQVFPEELSLSILEKTEKAIRTREVQSFEYRYKRDFRKYIFEEIRIISTGDNEVLVIMRDITEGKQAQLRLKKAMEEAREANSIKSTFIANISHEIRTPINSILGFSDLLASELKTESQLKNLESIKSSSKTLLSLINDILDISKIEAGKMTVKYHDVNLKMLVKEIENIFSLKVSEKELKYFTHIDKSIPDVIRFDEMRLKQILMNLVSNAIKFTDFGIVRLSVKLTNKYCREFVECIDIQIEVEDTGVGIKRENQELIFEAFKQQDEQDARKYGGTGLGLAITKKLVELLKGRLEVFSDIGKGSKFSIYFPGIEVSKHGYVETKKSDNIKIGQYIFKPACILIADYDLKNREIIRNIFLHSTMEFLMAENGKAAIQLINSKKPDIALLDIQMPHIDGLEVAKYIKTNKKLKDITTIGISAFPLTYNSDIRSVYLDDFVPKPININLLLRKLVKFLEIADNKIKSRIDKKVQAGKFQIEGEFLKKFYDARTKIIDPALRQMSNSSSFRDYESFGKTLKRVGEDVQITRLAILGTAIMEAVKTFDLESLAKLVADYKIFEKKLLNKSNEEI